jgi:hypothetical protein
MKTITVKLNIDQQKYEAAKQFMEEKGLDIEQELSKSVSKLYEKYVPSPVRKYIEKTSPISTLPVNSKADSADSRDDS